MVDQTGGQSGGRGAPADGAGRPASAGAQKGVFDHLAEYLLQQPGGGQQRAGREAAPPSAPVPPAEAPQPAKALSTDAGSQGGLQAHELVFSETAEQLSVEKEMFVREEVVLRKVAQEHVEQIDDKVRRTEVEVERLTPAEAERIAAGEPPAKEQAPMAAAAPAPREQEPISFGGPLEKAEAPVAAAAPVRPQQERISFGGPPERPAPIRSAAAPAEASPAAPIPAPPAAKAVPAAPVARSSRPAKHSAGWWMWFVLILVAALLIAYTIGQFIGSAS